ncbi:UDP-N-acetylglucosamine 1-carboxyvinyltransferase [Drechslerella dactyloides]|uniref:UDP-N-acetylglucosamine 1-carboxyvinyltransferase n=1 Tax=Drechslerella dactyloides TaxID=74499 RepID=A0AAD6IQC7_DREDA|nr:UDP-N-acetylglucosamine 1-carboxyvinyltransferase [Drechslerella dactyloides]
MKPDNSDLRFDITNSAHETLSQELAILLPTCAEEQDPGQNISRHKTDLHIEGGRQLKGEITLKTSKNAAVALLCASLLNHGVTRFLEFPRIEEVFRIIEVLRSLGVRVEWTDNSTIEIRRPESLQLNNINNRSAKATRSVLMLIGALMHENDDFKIPCAGGCELGQRTVGPHVDALAEFGVHVSRKGNVYRVAVDKRSPGEVTLHEAGNTVTNNILLAAARTPEETVIQAASADYMVQDLCFFLQGLGVDIEGIGTPLLRIKGLNRIEKGIAYAATEDPIEAMFFIAVAVTTNSEITIRRLPFRWISLELLKLKKMGLRYTIARTFKASNGHIDLADLIVHRHEGSLKALPDKIHPNLWPGINPDSLPYFVPIAAVAEGHTFIHDWMFEGRAVHFREMAKLGVDIELADSHRLYVRGPTKFHKPEGELVCPPALRPASVLLIGLLAASGVSVMRNVYTIHRGYEDIAARLSSLGARVREISDNE